MYNDENNYTAYNSEPQPQPQPQSVVEFVVFCVVLWVAFWLALRVLQFWVLFCSLVLRAICGYSFQNQKTIWGRVPPALPIVCPALPLICKMEVDP